MNFKKYLNERREIGILPTKFSFFSFLSQVCQIDGLLYYGLIERLLWRVRRRQSLSEEEKQKKKQKVFKISIPSLLLLILSPLHGHLTLSFFYSLLWMTPRKLNPNFHFSLTRLHHLSHWKKMYIFKYFLKFNNFGPI